jgi:hypothetical protein
VLARPGSRSEARAQRRRLPTPSRAGPRQAETARQFNCVRVSPPLWPANAARRRREEGRPSGRARAQTSIRHAKIVILASGARAGLTTAHLAGTLSTGRPMRPLGQFHFMLFHVWCPANGRRTADERRRARARHTIERTHNSHDSRRPANLLWWTISQVVIDFPLHAARRSRGSAGPPPAASTATTPAAQIRLVRELTQLVVVLVGGVIGAARWRLWRGGGHERPR